MQTKLYMILMAILLVLTTMINADVPRPSRLNVNTNGYFNERRATLKQLVKQQANNKQVQQKRRVSCIGIDKCMT